jgi:uncharacterized ferredoxin-like protein
MPKYRRFQMPDEQPKDKGEDPITQPSVNGESIQLGEREQEDIRKLEQKLLQVKLNYADFELAVASQRAVLQQQLVDAQRMYTEEAANIARNHGIDPNDPKSGRWNLDIAQMTLNRIG